MVRDAADPRFRRENLPAPCAKTSDENFELFCALLRSLAPVFDGFRPSREVSGDPPFLL